jgi:nucleoside-diphosphate-sugar epimerase
VRVLVTGASGFVGHAACRELIARGHDVRALVRRAGSEPAGTAAVAGDLTDAGALGAAVREAAPKVVFTSTVVTGEAGGALLSEDEPLPVQTPYGRSKQDGEALLFASGLPAVVVRPGHVYGPGGWYEHEMLARLRQPGRFAVIGRGDNLWAVLHVDDVARALADGLERRDRRGSARTSNAKLKRELGWAPRYPSARDRVPATVAALRAAP